MCGSLITLSSAGVYTYFKVSKVLEKNDKCIKVNEDFKARPKPLTDPLDLMVPIDPA